MTPQEAASVLWDAVMSGMGTFNSTKVAVTWGDGTVVELGEYGVLRRAAETLAEHHGVFDWPDDPEDPT